MERPLVVYVDVDDTLMRSFGSKRIPISHTVDRVRALWSEGVTLYCWSSGGGEYARASAVELGIEQCFAGFLPKPNVLIDDVRLAKWHELVEVHPNSLGQKSRTELEEIVRTGPLGLRTL